MIVVLDDEDLKEMLDLKSRGGKPEEVIRRAVGEFRMRL
jgi:hypothetical protein